MKRILLGFCLSLFCFFTVFAQSPLYIPYQAVARNAAGNLLVNQQVGLQFTIYKTSASGTVVYQETQTTHTNSLGLFNVNIGNGTIVSGSFSTIPWGSNAIYTDVQIDPNGGTNYVDMGTSQMMSVPYALYAGSASSVALTAGSGIAVSGDQVSETLPITSLNTSATSGAASISSGVLSIPNYTLAGLGGQAAITAGTGLSFSSNTLNSVWTVSGSNIYNNNSGDVGIGVTSPTYNLDVSGNSRITTAPASSAYSSLYLNSTTTSSNYSKYEPLQLSNGGYFAGAVTGIGFYNSGTTYPTGKIISTMESAGTGGQMDFYTMTGSNVSTDRMTITGTGNVGIGTTSPSAPLQIGSSAFAQSANMIFYTGNGAQNRGWQMGAQYGNTTTTSPNYGFVITDLGNSTTPPFVIDYNTHDIGLSIGNTAPTQLLTVNGSAALWNTNQVQFYTDAGSTERGYVGDATTTSDMSLVGTVSGDWLRIGANASSICFFPDGTVSSGSFPMVKINPETASTGANPGGTVYAVLEVWGEAGSPLSSNSTSDNQGSKNYEWVNSGNTGNASASGRAYSLYTWNSIWCGNGEIDCTSDERIKDVLDSSNNAKDLESIDKLKVVDYQYIDKIANGNKKVKGFLAQQVETVFPDAVNELPGVIPNIYKNADAVSYDAGSKKLTVTLNAGHGLVKGDKVQLVVEAGGKSNAKNANVCRVIDKHTFVVDNWDTDNRQVFVYGKEVPDLHNLDYNKIFSAGISAIQELSKQVDALKNENAGLKQTIKTTDLKYDQLKAQVNDLQSLMEKNSITGEK